MSTQTPSLNVLEGAVGATSPQYSLQSSQDNRRRSFDRRFDAECNRDSNFNQSLLEELRETRRQADKFMAQMKDVVDAQSQQSPPQPAPYQPKGVANKRKLICHFCDRPGHVASSCFLKQQQRRNTKNSDWEEEKKDNNQSSLAAVQHNILSQQDDDLAADVL